MDDPRPLGVNYLLQYHEVLNEKLIPALHAQDAAGCDAARRQLDAHLREVEEAVRNIPLAGSDECARAIVALRGTWANGVVPSEAQIQETGEIGQWISYAAELADGPGEPAQATPAGAARLSDDEGTYRTAAELQRIAALAPSTSSDDLDALRLEIADWLTLRSRISKWTALKQRGRVDWYELIAAEAEAITAHNALCAELTRRGVTVTGKRFSPGNGRL